MDSCLMCKFARKSCPWEYNDTGQCERCVRLGLPCFGRGQAPPAWFRDEKDSRSVALRAATREWNRHRCGSQSSEPLCLCDVLREWFPYGCLAWKCAYRAPPGVDDEVDNVYFASQLSGPASTDPHLTRFQDTINWWSPRKDNELQYPYPNTIPDNFMASGPYFSYHASTSAPLCYVSNRDYAMASNSAPALNDTHPLFSPDYPPSLSASNYPLDANYVPYPLHGDLPLNPNHAGYHGWASE